MQTSPPAPEHSSPAQLADGDNQPSSAFSSQLPGGAVVSPDPEGNFARDQDPPPGDFQHEERE
jgi:hypothetical protein